jgi:hypothetical protein
MIAAQMSMRPVISTSDLPKEEEPPEESEYVSTVHGPETEDRPPSRQQRRYEARQREKEIRKLQKQADQARRNANQHRLKRSKL